MGTKSSDMSSHLIPSERLISETLIKLMNNETLVSVSSMMNSTNSSLDDIHPPHVFHYTLIQKIIFATIMIPIIIFSISGNILVLVAITKYSYLKITNNIFLASLAVADCAVGILAMTLNALQLLSGQWYLKSFMCRFWLASDVLFSTASILNLFCVSVDRYLSISDKYAFSYISEHPTKSWRVRIMIISVWITSSLLSFGPIYTNWFTTPEHALKIDKLDYEVGQCAMIVNVPYRFISSSVSFWLPGIGMIIFYAMVMKKAYVIENNQFKTIKHLSIPNEHSSQRRATNAQHRFSASNLKLFSNLNGSKMDDLNAVRKASTNEDILGEQVSPLLQHKASVTINETSATNHDAENKSKSLNRNGQSRHNSKELIKWKREFKALKTLGTVMAVFCLCWIFFFLKYTLCGETFNVCPDIIRNSLVLEDILFWIGYFNSMINPFLYNFTNQDFRKAFRQLLGIEKKKRDRPSFVTKHCFCFKSPSPDSRSTSLISQGSGNRKMTIDEQYLSSNHN